MPAPITGALTNLLIPLVYETLGDPDGSGIVSRIEPAGDDSVVTRYLNRAYSDFARRTRCFRREATFTYLADAINKTNHWSLPVDMFDVTGARLSTTTGLPIQVIPYRQLQRDNPYWRSVLASSAPLYLFNPRERTIGLYPPLHASYVTWTTATAYLVRTVVKDDGDVWMAAFAHTSASASQPSTAVDWSGSTSYTVLECVTATSGDVYQCTVAHTASSATEPGVGATWQSAWRLLWWCEASLTHQLPIIEGYVLPIDWGDADVPDDAHTLLILGEIEDPDIPVRYYDALAYRAATEIAALILADDPAVALRGASASTLYKQAVESYIKELQSF